MVVKVVTPTRLLAEAAEVLRAVREGVVVIGGAVLVAGDRRRDLCEEPTGSVVQACLSCRPACLGLFRKSGRS
jgi:hypothetical protein